MTLRWLPLLLVGTACTTVSTGPASLDVDAAEREYDGQDGPCIGGGWGSILGAPSAVHVRVNGSDATGNGSFEAPYASIDHALTQAGPGARRVAIGPGEFEANLDFQGGGPVRLMGCSADQTTLVSGTDDDPVIDVRQHQPVRIEGLGLRGGTATLRVGGEGKVRLVSSSIADGHKVGALVHGCHAKLFVKDSEIRDTLPASGYGWGLAAFDGKVEIDGGTLSGNTEIGLYADGATVDATDLDILDTQPSATAEGLGRALHAQGGTDLTVTGGLFQNNADTGLFLLEAGAVVINGLVIDITSAGIVIDFPSTGYSGDGIVVLGSDDVEIYDTLVSASARAALLFDGTQVHASGNETSSTGLTIDDYTKFSQRHAHVSGDDAPDVLDLPGPLLLNDRPLQGGGLGVGSRSCGE